MLENVTEDKSDEEKKEAVKIPTYETVNKATALWTLNDIPEKDYIEFYKHISHDFADPLIWTHNHVEGTLDYTLLLYIPEQAPFDLWNREMSRGLKLYVQRCLYYG